MAWETKGKELERLQAVALKQALVTGEELSRALRLYLQMLKAHGTVGEERIRDLEGYLVEFLGALAVFDHHGR